MIKFISLFIISFILSCNTVYEQRFGKSYSLIVKQRDIDKKSNIYISVEFLISTYDSKKYPQLIASFTNALDEWAKYIPIRTTIYFEDLESIWFSSSIKDRPGVIGVSFVDLQAQPHLYDESVVGIWEADFRKILFDLDYSQDKPEKMYSTALHELGHVFGLPHIIDKDESGPTGDIVLDEGDASEYVMYHKSAKNKPQDVLSEIEIEIAKRQVMYIFSLDNLTSNNCEICVDEYKY